MNMTNQEWLQLVKATRQKFGVGISEAHRLILDDPVMRRLVGRRVNTNAACRKTALSDIRATGESSIFVKDGPRLRYRNTSSP